MRYKEAPSNFLHSNVRNTNKKHGARSRCLPEGDTQLFDMTLFNKDPGCAKKFLLRTKSLRYSGNDKQREKPGRNHHKVKFIYNGNFWTFELLHRPSLAPRYNVAQLYVTSLPYVVTFVYPCTAVAIGLRLEFRRSVMPTIRRNDVNLITVDVRKSRYVHILTWHTVLDTCG